jgi:hypothetical protein
MTTSKYLGYHYSSFACWGGNPHQWVDTGYTRQMWTSSDTKGVPPKDLPVEREQKCFCGEIRWVSQCG